MASGGVRIEETIPCAFAGSGAALERLLAASRADGAYQAAQVAPDRVQFARTFRPTWAVVAGVATLPAALLGLVFFLVKTTETCLAVIESDHRGTRVRLSGKLASATLGRVRVALADGDSPAMYASPIGAPVASTFEARAAPLVVAPAHPPPLIDLRPGTPASAPVETPIDALSLLPPPVGSPVVLFGGSWPPHHATARPDRVAPDSGGRASPDLGVTIVATRTTGTTSATAMGAAPIPVLVVDDGLEVELRSHNLLGRDPTVGTDDGDTQLVAVSDDSRSVSKTHLSITYLDAAWHVVDRYSTNGVAVVGPDGTERPARPGEPTVVPMGSSVRFGQRTFRIVARGAGS